MDGLIFIIFTHELISKHNIRESYGIVISFMNAGFNNTVHNSIKNTIEHIFNNPSFNSVQTYGIPSVKKPIKQLLSNPLIMQKFNPELKNKGTLHNQSMKNIIRRVSS